MSQTRTISAMNARQQLGQLLDDVRFRSGEVVIEKNGQPAAVLISVELHAQYTRLREADFAKVEAIRAKLKGDTELEADILEASAEVRQKR